MNVIKVKLEELIPILSEAYEQGADYVDLEMSKTPEGDSFLKVRIRPQYMSEEVQEEESPNITVYKLEDDDLNKLM